MTESMQIHATDFVVSINLVTALQLFFVIKMKHYPVVS